MKGLIFTEFIEMVENKMGYEMAHQIIERSSVESQGIYTAVGTYPEEEMIALLRQLSSQTGIEIPSLLITFGNHLFQRFSVLYSHFFEGKSSAFEFLNEIEDYIHVEVLKLYPDALLPSIDIIVENDNTMTMVYRSPRRLSHLAFGLIQGCAEYFKEDISITETKNLKEGTEVWLQLIKS